MVVTLSGFWRGEARGRMFVVAEAVDNGKGGEEEELGVVGTDRDMPR